MSGLDLALHLKNTLLYGLVPTASGAEDKKLETARLKPAEVSWPYSAGLRRACKEERPEELVWDWSGSRRLRSVGLESLRAKTAQP